MSMGFQKIPNRMWQQKQRIARGQMLRDMDLSMSRWDRSTEQWGSHPPRAMDFIRMARMLFRLMHVVNRCYGLHWDVLLDQYANQDVRINRWVASDLRVVWSELYGGTGDCPIKPDNGLVTAYGYFYGRRVPLLMFDFAPTLQDSLCSFVILHVKDGMNPFTLIRAPIHVLLRLTPYITDLKYNGFDGQFIGDETICRWGDYVNPSDDDLDGGVYQIWSLHPICSISFIRKVFDKIRRDCAII